MNKSFILGVMAVAAMTLVSCQKEQDLKTKEESKGYPFELVAGTEDTKTVNDGLATNWVAGDQIGLFHAENGAEASTAVYDGAFTASADGASVTFSGTLADPLDGEKNYDWYAVYPFSDGLQTADAYEYVYIGSDAYSPQVQVGNDSKAHLAGDNYPLWGKKKNIGAATKPAIKLNHFASFVEVQVTNKTATPTKVTQIQLSSTADNEIVGEFIINLSGDRPAFTASETSNIATLNVTGADALAEDESASYFFAVKPFSATPGSKLTLTVTTDQGVQESCNIVPSKYDFEAGKIQKLKLNFTNKSISVAEFKYNTSAWLTAQGISPLPEPSAGVELSESVQTVSPITVQTLDLGTTTKIWNDGGNYEMRIYKKDKIHVSATGKNYMTKITFGSSTSFDEISADCGSFDTDSKTWIGKSQDVNFTLSDNSSTVKIQSIGVFYQDAGTSEFVVTLPEKAKNVAYSATSTSFDVKTVNLLVSDITFSSESAGYVNSVPGDGFVTVNFEANTSPSPRDIVVDVTNTSAGFAGTLTITQAGGPTSISSLTATSTDVTVDGKVTALTTSGFVLSDGTGSILVFTKTDVTPTYTIGQNMRVSGDVSVYNKGLQFNINEGKATLTPGSADTYDYPVATSYGLPEITAFNDDTSNRLAEYVQFSGVVVISGSYVNICGGLGASDNASIYYAPTSMTSGLATGDYVTVKGYATSVSSGRMSVCATEIIENDSAPGLRFSNISGVAASGVSGQTLTVTPYRIPGEAPVVSFSGCVSAASINAACNTVTYSVSENESSDSRVGTIVVTFTVGLNTYAYTIKVTQLGKTVGTNVTFDYPTLYASVTTGSKSLNGETDIVSGVSIKYDKVSGSNNPAYYANGTNLRIYNKSTMTITAPSEKKITKIDFSQGTTTWVSGKMAGDSGTVNDTNKVWSDATGANTVVLTITGSFRFTKIVVTYN